MRTVNPEWIQRKALSKLYISNKLCDLILCTNLSDEIKGIFIQNYISFFIDGVKAIVNVADKKSLIDDIKKYKRVLNNAKYTKSLNLKILCLMSKIFPSSFWIKTILKRYGVKK